MLVLVLAAVCGTADVDAICEDARLSVTAGPNPQDGPILDANTTYAVSGFAPGKRSFVVFEAQTSGEYELYLGGPPATAKVCDELPTCTSESGRCMRGVAVYAFEAGERYEIELSPIASGQRVLMHVHAPEDEEHVAGLSLHRGGLRRGTPLGSGALLRAVDVLDRVVTGQALVRHQRVAIGEHVGTLGVAAPLVVGVSARLTGHVVRTRAVARAGQPWAAHDVTHHAAREHPRDQ